MGKEKYFTIWQVEEYYSQIERKISFREALIRMDKEGRLSSEPGPMPALSFWQDHEAFERAYASIPMDASLILGLSESDFADRSILENAAFPPGQDVYPRKLIDGDPDFIPADSYVYKVRFHEDRDLVEVCMEDGRIAEIVFDGTESEDGTYLQWPYTIDGVDQEQYFDNLLFAD